MLGIPQSVGRLDHVTLMVALENFDAVVERYAAMLGIDFSTPNRREDLGAVSVINWDAGIEIMAPLSTGGVYADWLRSHGEGCYAICFGVLKLEEAVDRAIQNGAKVLFEGDGLAASPPWASRFEILRVAQLEPVHGATICLEQIERTDPAHSATISLTL